MQKDFSYPLHIADLNQQEQHYRLCANADERQALSEILKVEDVKSFSADIFLKLNLKQHCLDVWGTVDAVLELQSVVSLENFTKAFHVPFKYFYDTKATYKDIRELDLGIEDDVPDIIEDGRIDLANLAIEQLALAMDDYPRQEGETFSFASEFDEETTQKANPFAVLQKLKK